jgi:DNA modification methylase
MSWKDKFPKNNRYFETENGILYHGDCMEIIPQLPNDMINMVVTSPPYNVDLGNNKYKKTGYNSYKDDKDYSDYIDWMKDLFYEIYNKLVSGGRLCINIGDGKNGKIPTHSDLIQQLTKKYLLSSIIIWDKKQVGNRLSWGSFNSPKNVSYPTPFEYILLFCKEYFSLQNDGETDLDKEEFKKWAYAIWDFLPEINMKKYEHPAMFPEELPTRCIKMNSYIGDIVLEPFNGAGTTAYISEKLNRRWVAIEIDEKYCKTTTQRLKTLTPPTNILF